MIPSPVHNKFPCQVMIPSDTKTRVSFWLQKKSVKVPDSTKSGISPNNSCCFFFLQSFHPALTFHPRVEKSPLRGRSQVLTRAMAIANVPDILISRIAHCSRIPGLNIQYCSRSYPDFIAYPSQIHCLSLLSLRGLPIFCPAGLSSRTSLHLSPPTTRNANPAERAATQNLWCDDSGINVKICAK